MPGKSKNLHEGLLELVDSQSSDSEIPFFRAPVTGNDCVALGHSPRHTRTSRRGTTVLILTSDAGLVRLARSILEPTCTVIGRAPLSANADGSVERTDIVIIDAESVDHGLISMTRRACPEAQVIAMCCEFREADCVAFWTRTGITWLARFEPTISWRACESRPSGASMPPGVRAPTAGDGSPSISSTSG
jgi:hypothetical protein